MEREMAELTPLTEADLVPAPAHEPLDISTYLSRGRLQVTANVDGEGLERLVAILEKFRDILPAKQSA